jgi:copper chaperone CopZ
MRRLHVDIDGMSCGGCVTSVKNVLSRLEGVTRCEVTVGHADLDADDRVSDEAVKAAVERAGFTATSVQGSAPSP